MKNIAVKYDLLKHIKLQHRVIGAKWDAEEGLWHVKIRGPDEMELTDTCHILINASGILK